MPYPSLSLVYHPPPGTITELSRSVYRRCCPPLPPPTFPPQLLSHPLILSRSTSQRYSSSPFPFDLSSPSFSRYDSSAPPIERSSNSTTYRQIKFVLAVRVTFETREQIRRCEVRRGKNCSSRHERKGRNEIGNRERDEST